MQALSVYQDFLQQHSLPIPSHHVVLGSGFGTALGQFPWERVAELPFAALPGFSSSSVPDHVGCYRFYRREKRVVSFQMGRLHGYEGHAPAKVTQTVMVPRLAGVKSFLLTNASGSLSLSYRPGDVMLLRDHVNLTGLNPLVGPNPAGPDGSELGPRFPDLSRLYDRDWRRSLAEHCRRQGLVAHEGVYLGLLGPSFETPSEVQLFASWGLHAVGMSTVWEAIALGHSGARVAGLSLLSNLGAGLTDRPLDHLAILDTCRASAEKVIRAFHACLEEELGRA